MPGRIRRGAISMSYRAMAAPALPATSISPARLRSIRRPASLNLHGEPAALPSRPIHASVDASGGYLLTAYNNPSNITVHRLNADGTVGAPVAQPGKLDTGIYAHQVLAMPGNRTVLLVTRGNHAEAGKPEDPGAIKTFTLQERRAEQSRLDRARQRARLRAAPSRLSSERAVGIRFDRAAEQALCL